MARRGPGFAGEVKGADAPSACPTTAGTWVYKLGVFSATVTRTLQTNKRFECNCGGTWRRQPAASWLPGSAGRVGRSSSSSLTTLCLMWPFRTSTTAPDSFSRRWWLFFRPSITQYNTMQYSTTQYIIIHYNTVLYNTIWYDTKYNSITLQLCTTPQKEKGEEIKTKFTDPRAVLPNKP